MSEKMSNMASPLPWFRIFASHYLADRNFRTASLEERGLVLSMQLECWVCTDIPSDPTELSQILGVPSDQVKRSLSPKVLSFFNTRNENYYSQFLDDQRNEFLARRKKQSEGGHKGAIKKKMSHQTEPDGQPTSQPAGSSYQIQSSPVTSNSVPSLSVNQEKDVSGELENHKEWINAFDGISNLEGEQIKQ